MRKLEISLTKVSQYEFQGKMRSNQLFAHEIMLLGINQDLENAPEEIEVSGDFNVSWDREIPLVNIEALYAFYGDKDLEFNIDFIDLEELCEEIEQSGHDEDWKADLLAKMGDRQYDSLMDK